MFDIKKAILRHIITAQIASDIAKGQLFVEYQGFQGYKVLKTLGKTAAYQVKDNAIKQALSLIDSVSNCGVNYYCVRQEDQNGQSSNVIYFTFKIEGRRYQISFHNFRSDIKRAYALPQKGRECHWEGGIGGSRKAAIETISHYFNGTQK